jgi:carbon-monoxide dehydrogenase medium subunit
LSAKVAQEGLAAATPEAIAQAVKEVAPEKTAGDRRLFVTVIERCLRRALGE